MNVCLKISVQDNEGVSHNDNLVKFSSEATVKQLRGKITSLLEIAPEYQRLFYNECEIDDLRATLLQLGIKHKDKIIVKHSLINNWDTLLIRYKNLKFLRRSELQGNIADSLLGMGNHLYETKFFQCYPSLAILYDRISPYICEYLGGFRETIEMASRYYFFEIKKNERPDPSIFKISFDDKKDGVHSGRLCTVDDVDGKSLFYIKTNYGGPTKSNSSSGLAPNLKELFVYSLLQIIAVGPESHFICPPPGTAKKTIFIATKAIPDFGRNRMDKLSSKTKNIKNILIEIHILCSILYITDVHQDNCGQHDMKPIIIDFAVPLRDDYKREDVLQVICEGTPAPASTLENGIENKDLKRVASGCSSEERIEIAKKSLKGWDLMDAIDKAEARMNEVKEVMRSQGVWIVGTDDFTRYVADIKYNCSLVL